MTIDEAIAKYKEISNADANCPAHCNISCDKCVQESEQLVEWLEELKDYRDKNKMVVRIDVQNMDSIRDKIEELSRYAESQYNKARGLSTNDDKYCITHYDNYLKVIKEIAEQLKAGDNNGT